MSELRIRTFIRSRYQVFDASGQLPFSVVFGLCRSQADTDPRAIQIDTTGSVLDVPYALAHGLLTLHQQDPGKTTQWVEVDLSGLDGSAAEHSDYISLPSRVNSTESWRNALTIHQGYITMNGGLDSILKPGEKYRLRLGGDDLGVKRWAYGDREQFVGNDGKPSLESETARLVTSTSRSGIVDFEVVKYLRWPPRIETRMRLCALSPSSDTPPANHTPNGTTALEVFVINTGSDPVTVQTRGHQRYLTPWGPFQPEPDADDDRARIICASPRGSGTSGLQVTDSATGAVVRGNRQQGGCRGLTTHDADLRPNAEDLLTLEPGAPSVRRIDIEGLVRGLGDGQYKIQVQPRGCRWWPGKVGKEECEDGKVPTHLGGSNRPPLMLEPRTRWRYA